MHVKHVRILGLVGKEEKAALLQDIDKRLDALDEGSRAGPRFRIELSVPTFRCSRV